jgi:hypothetical protein
MCTHPDIAPCLTFLASYQQSPSEQHYKAAVHTLKYLYSTNEYGISFHSNSSSTLQAFNHFPHHHDKEAYTDATPPLPVECHKLTGFSDACWGGQFGNAVPDGTPLELFKFRSLSGYVVARSGGPISWRSIRQSQCTQSSCKTEVVATNECALEVENIRHRANDLNCPDASEPTTIYNDNTACVAWSSALTTKGIKYLNLRETKVRELCASRSTSVLHIPGQINSSDIFTKEIKDAAYFRRLPDTMMVSRTNFNKFMHVIPSHYWSKESLPYYLLRSPSKASTLPVAE